jgi:hypothetical protein
MKVSSSAHDANISPLWSNDEIEFRTDSISVSISSKRRYINPSTTNRHENVSQVFSNLQHMFGNEV